MSKFIQINIYLLWITLFFIIFIISLNFIHPFILIIYIIFFNIIICIKLSIWYINYIYSILLFLIIIRGLLVIFIYFSRLIANERIKINMNLKLFFLFNLNFLIYLYYLINLKFFHFYLFNFSTNKNYSINSIFINKLQTLINIYIYPARNFTLLRIFFILLAFITIIKINSSTHSLTLRKLSSYE